jgi:class 3 adenylate cyclase/tetratricopeptide (TPR) repeat protein
LALGSRVREAMTRPASGLITLLFTDLVGSTELLSRAGDEEAQQIFQAHHQLLGEAVARYGGHEVKWLGDGLMAAFSSAADAVSCAMAIQRASRRSVAGERLSIRVGLHAGEAIRDATDYFGTPVVLARRLCDQAEAGQILCSELVAGLLSGHADFAFHALGRLRLAGLPDPVGVFEVRYGQDVVRPFSEEVPLVARQEVLGRVFARLAEAAVGRGGLVLVVGEQGIGKTRLLEEVAAKAKRVGALVLRGRGYEGEWSPPFTPFLEALESHVLTADREELRADLGAGAALLAQLVPRVREILPDLPGPASMAPEEERFRLTDSVARFLVARSRRAPVLLCLDDLQWADRSSVALLRHLARVTPRERILSLGAYLDVGLDRAHPLREALGALPREAGYELLRLEGLDATGVSQLLAALGGHEIEDKVGAAWARYTEGNPFFVRELLRHLLEEGSLYRGPDGRWTTTRPLRELGVPASIRDVVARRLSRLSGQTGKLLGAAAAFDGPFPFEVVGQMAGLSELDALDALDEAVAADLVKPAGVPETYAFTHSLVRQTVYGELTPSRQVRLHRRAAEVLEAASKARLSPARAGEIAAQYHRSRDLPGAGRGVLPAVAAASHAQATGGYDEAGRFLRMALEMLPPGDERAPGLLGRLGIVLASMLAFDHAVEAAARAGEAIAEAEGKEAAGDYLSVAAYTCALAAGTSAAWELAQIGLGYAEPGSIAWARLVSLDHERQAAEDRDHPGIPLDTPERREAARLLRAARLDPLAPGPMEAVFDSREEALTSSNLIVLSLWAGEYVRCLPRLKAAAEEAESLGRLPRAARAWSAAATSHAALGRLAEARAALEKAHDVMVRLGSPVVFVLVARECLSAAEDEGWEELAAMVGPLIAREDRSLAWAIGLVSAFATRAAAHRGHVDEALGFLGLLVSWLERAPAWTPGFPAMASDAAEALWLLGRLDHIVTIERALEKVVAAGFHFPMVDARLALARCCALRRRHDEASEWFAEARSVLAGLGCRPLLAVCDHDEALMYGRRRAPGDAERARGLLHSARRQFQALGMTGWIRRADRLASRLGLADAADEKTNGAGRD